MSFALRITQPSQVEGKPDVERWEVVDAPNAATAVARACKRQSVFALRVGADVQAYECTPVEGFHVQYSNPSGPDYGEVILERLP